MNATCAASHASTGRFIGRSAVALCALLLFATALPAAAKESFREISGTLVLVGGGKLPDAARDRFLELAGGAKANLVVIPTASPSVDGPDAEKALDSWKALNPTSVALLHTLDKKKADDPEFVKPLTEATGRLVRRR